uniref:Uncharacterized protein n=1 Tax=Cryptosporidium parvum TaxID=5807 RepID=F0X549_CRYPV
MYDFEVLIMHNSLGFVCMHYCGQLERDTY